MTKTAPPRPSELQEHGAKPAEPRGGRRSNTDGEPLVLQGQDAEPRTKRPRSSLDVFLGAARQAHERAIRDGDRALAKITATALASLYSARADRVADDDEWGPGGGEV